MKRLSKIRMLPAAIALIAALSINAQQAKYIFYFIGDGMGPGQVMMADCYRRLALGDSLPLTMMQLPARSMITTWSASSPVTDSAAAGTALSTGVKTKNSMLGMSPDTVAVTSIAKTLHDNGYGVAIMTNVAADDATPAAFYAHVPNRGQYYEIGRQAAESGYELIAGAALRGMNKDGKPTGLKDYIASQGVDIVTDPAGVATSGNPRVILLPETSLWEWNMGFNVDNIEGEMSVSDLTETAISHLSRHTPEKFFIMIEGGNIDHAAHANDGGTVVKEVVAFDEAVARAVEFYNLHPDETLIVITADHETGGMSVGNNHTGYMAYPQYLIPQKVSKDIFSTYCDDLMKREQKPQWDDMRRYLSDNLGLFTDIPVSGSEADRLKKVFDSTFIDGQARRQETLYSNFNQFAVEVFELLNGKAGVGWTTLSHSGNFVPVFAIGTGAGLFPAVSDNTGIPSAILQAAGLGQ